MWSNRFVYRTKKKKDFFFLICGALSVDVLPQTEVWRIDPSKSKQMHVQCLIPGRPAGNSTAECLQAAGCQRLCAPRWQGALSNL